MLTEKISRHGSAVSDRVGEAELQRELLAAIPKRLPTLRLYRRMVGTADAGGRHVAFGIKGQCDLYGFTRLGTHVEVELKAAGGSLSEAQYAWLNSLHGWGVVWFQFQASRGESCADTIDRWLECLHDGLQGR